jgi:threonine dehydratase
VIGLDDIRAARERIAPYVRRTPLLAPTSAKDPLPAAAVSLKLECLQVTGSFKARGAMNRVLATPRAELAGGIVTASGGNHGLAVARTAYVAGVPATVFLPSNVSPAKVEKLKGWQARVEIVGEVWDAANEAALAHARTHGALYLHPFADPLVVAGQGTLALDLLEELPALDLILIAIGGGGLIAGMATALKALRPGIRIVGVEPTGSPTLKASLDAGHVVTLPEVTTAVPTMACRRTDERIFDLVRGAVDEVVLVTDDEMRAAARWLWFEAGVAADLSGAAAVASLRAGRVACPPDANICALVCGAGPEGVA